MLVVYRGGDVVASVVQAAAALAARAAADRGVGGGALSFAAEDLEWLLRENGALAKDE